MRIVSRRNVGGRTRTKRVRRGLPADSESDYET